MVTIDNGSGDFLVKKWIAILTILIMSGSLIYSVSMSLAINPLDRRVGKNEVINEQQNAKIHEIDKLVEANRLHYEHINGNLEDIKKLLIENK